MRLLDPFDMLGAVYDYPQLLETVDDWFKKMDFVDVEVETVGALVITRARSPRRRSHKRVGEARVWA